MKNSNITTPFRDSSPTDIPDRVAKLEADVESIQSGFREGVWTGWKHLGWLVSSLAIIAAILFVGHFVVTRTVFRGSVLGAAARRNSEREALRWGKGMWPNITPADVYCTSNGTFVVEQDCYVTDPTRTTWKISCDDDEPVTNDGCNASDVSRVNVLPAAPIPMVPIPMVPLTGRPSGPPATR